MDYRNLDRPLSVSLRMKAILDDVTKISCPGWHFVSQWQLISIQRTVFVANPCAVTCRANRSHHARGTSRASAFVAGGRSSGPGRRRLRIPLRPGDSQGGCVAGSFPPGSLPAAPSPAVTPPGGGTVQSSGGGRLAPWTPCGRPLSAPSPLCFAFTPYPRMSDALARPCRASACGLRSDRRK